MDDSKSDKVTEGHRQYFTYGSLETAVYTFIVILDFIIINIDEKYGKKK